MPLSEGLDYFGQGKHCDRQPPWPTGQSAVAVAVVFVSSAWAQGQQSFSKSLLTTTTPEIGEAVEYRLDFSYSSLTTNCGNLTISDQIDPALQVTSRQVPPDFNILSCPDGGNQILIEKVGTFEDGGSFSISIFTRVDLATPPGTVKRVLTFLRMQQSFDQPHGLPRPPHAEMATVEFQSRPNLIQDMYASNSEYSYRNRWS